VADHATPNNSGSGSPKATKKKKVYESIISRVFSERFSDGATQVEFTREDLVATASSLGVHVKNYGDLLYTYRYRRKLPKVISERAPEESVWIIRGRGAAAYRFVAVPTSYAYIRPRDGLSVIKVPDATPGIIGRYKLDDEQALLAKVRYNRLVDVFMGVATYSLQNHLRTQVDDLGQVETDEVYVGVDRQGAHYVFPVQAKGGSDKHSIVQVEQDFAMCAARFPHSICRAIAAQFIDDSQIALFSFKSNSQGEAEYLDERHYRLVPHDSISAEELEAYRQESTRLVG
jgi:hypothetical protein